jgi:DNA repair protein RadC
MVTKLSIKSLNLDDQPRFKIRAKGISSLSNTELIALLLGSGSKEHSAISVAHDILQLCEGNLDELGKLSLGDLIKVKSVGEAKACVLLSAIELGRRRENSNYLSRTVVTRSGDIARYLQTMIKDYSHEVFGIVLLNRANKILTVELISSGGLTSTVADPRIILKKALLCNATSLVLFHCHPSGNLRPSQADLDLTQKIQHAASFCDLKLIDHIIISSEGTLSFADEGFL